MSTKLYWAPWELVPYSKLVEDQLESIVSFVWPSVTEIEYLCRQNQRAHSLAVVVTEAPLTLVADRMSKTEK